MYYTLGSNESALITPNILSPQHQSTQSPTNQYFSGIPNPLL